MFGKNHPLTQRLNALMARGVTVDVRMSVLYQDKKAGRTVVVPLETTKDIDKTLVETLANDEIKEFSYILEITKLY